MGVLLIYQVQRDKLILLVSAFKFGEVDVVVDFASV